MFRYACNADFCRSIEASAPPPPESSVQNTLVWAGLGTRLAENNPKAVAAAEIIAAVPKDGIVTRSGKLVVSRSWKFRNMNTPNNITQKMPPDLILAIMFALDQDDETLACLRLVSKGFAYIIKQVRSGGVVSHQLYICTNTNARAVVPLCSRSGMLARAHRLLVPTFL